MELGIRGKTALVTGGASGIGAETASQLAQEGANVVIADINAEHAGACAAALGGGLAQAMGVRADVTDAESVAQLIEKTIERFGRIDILINNGGFTRDFRLTDMPEGAWDAVVDVVLKGAFLVSKAAVPHMVKQRAGRIINISSRAHLGNRGQANDSAAKAGLLGFTRALALEYCRDYITVNAVAPGIIDTAAVTGLPHYEKIREAAARTTPLPRIGHVRDVADAILFLASERASYITGEVPHVTGGRY